MNTQEAIQQLDAQPTMPNPLPLDRHATWINCNSGRAFRFNPANGQWEHCPSADVKCVEPEPCQSYSTLKPADAVSHLNERLASECDRFEHDTGLKLATIKVNRDKKAGDIFVSLQAHVR